MRPSTRTEIIGFGLIILGLYWALATAPSFQSRRDPVIFLEVNPRTPTVKMGDPITIDMLIDKTRDDCTNGQALHHMRSVETGYFYKVFEQPTLSLYPGEYNFPLIISTTPIDSRKLPLMQPGAWRIHMRVDYDCPEGVKTSKEQTPIFYMESPK